MLDSPVITGWRAHSLQVLKHSRLIGKVSPGKVSQKRRYQWPNREAVYEHFKSKTAFARWDDRVLRGYDLYVANGSAYASGRLNLKRELLRRTLRLGFVRWRQFNTLPLNLYLCAYTD